MKEKISKNHRLHQRYTSLVTGLDYPGGSTIAGLLDKGMGMVGSAVKLTKAGYDYKKIWEEKRDAGSCLHGMIEAYLKKKEFDGSVFSGNMIKRAENSILKFYEWEKQHQIEILFIEHQMISEELKAGGTADLIAKVDGRTTLIDYKSGGLYESAFVQLSGYAEIALHNGISIEQILPLHIPQTETDEFSAKYLTELQVKAYKQIFKKLCDIYWLKCEMKKGD